MNIKNPTDEAMYKDFRDFFQQSRKLLPQEMLISDLSFIFESAWRAGQLFAMQKHAESLARLSDNSTARYGECKHD